MIEITPDLCLSITQVIVIQGLFLWLLAEVIHWLLPSLANLNSWQVCKA